MGLVPEGQLDGAAALNMGMIQAAFGDQGGNYDATLGVEADEEKGFFGSSRHQRQKEFGREFAARQCRPAPSIAVRRVSPRQARDEGKQSGSCLAQPLAMGDIQGVGIKDCGKGTIAPKEFVGEFIGISSREREKQKEFEHLMILEGVQALLEKAPPEPSPMSRVEPLLIPWHFAPFVYGFRMRNLPSLSDGCNCPPPFRLLALSSAAR